MPGKQVPDLAGAFPSNGGATDLNLIHRFHELLDSIAQSGRYFEALTED
jgi:hypothetical protein